MREIKFKISIILLLVSVMGVAALVGIAQSENANNKADNFDDNLNLVRIFRLVNGLNKEAEKQETKGFAKRAEMLRNYFQKKTGISNEAKLKLNELATNFQKELEKVNAEIKEVRKNQKNKPNDEALTSELGKLRESRNKLFDVSRESLKNDVSKDDSEKVLKFLRENIIKKLKTENKPNPSKRFKNKTSLKLFNNISYNESKEEGTLNGEIEGYSIIEYDAVFNELWSGSFTIGTCLVNNQESEPEYECEGSAVYAVLSDSEGGVANETDIGMDNNFAEAYIFWTPISDGNYCVDAEHYVEDTDYTTLYVQSSDCVSIALIDKVQYQIPNTSNYTDIEDTLYVLKGTTVEFKATTQSDDGIEGNWSGTSGVSGRGETASATFNNISSSVTDYKTVIVSNGSNQKNVNVVVYELTGILTPDDDFAGRSQDRYGLREDIQLTFSTNPNLNAETVGGLQWKVILGQGTLLNNSTNGVDSFSVSTMIGNVTLKLEVLEGASKSFGKTYSKSIVAPTTGMIRRHPDDNTIWHCQNYASAGFYAEIRIAPKDVSFSNLFFREGSIMPSIASGYYSSSSNSNHESTQFMTQITDCNLALGCKGLEDRVWSGKGYPPFSNGEFEWEIPWSYAFSIDLDPAYSGETNFDIGVHNQISNAQGTVTIKKNEAGPFSSVVNALDVNCQDE